MIRYRLAAALMLCLASLAGPQGKEEPPSCQNTEGHKCECHKSCDRDADPNKSEDPKCQSYCKPGNCHCRPKCAT